MTVWTHSFMSADTGAPSLGNTAGALITVLDALLVNGYNSKTVTITRTGTTATVNCTSHGFRNGQILAVSGANESDYNITARCTYVDANNVTYQVANSPTTPATGTITAIVAGAGWTKAYSGTNKAAYKQPAIADTQFYLRVDDSNTADSRLVGYESMSDVDTGTNAFPTSAQFSGGLYLYKCNGTTRSWRAFVNGGTIYLMARATSTPTWDNSNYGASFYFGNFTSFLPVESYNCILIAQINSGVTGGADSIHQHSSSADAGGHYIARGYIQTGGSVTCKKGEARLINVGSAYMGGSGPVYPDPALGGAILDLPILSEGDKWRGYLRGIYSWSHSSGFVLGDTFTGGVGGDLSGKKFEQFEARTGYGAYCLETSDDWT